MGFVNSTGKNYQ